MSGQAKALLSIHFRTVAALNDRTLYDVQGSEDKDERFVDPSV
jgi:hypothetical protein